MSTLQSLIEDRKELVEHAQRIVEGMRLDVRIMRREEKPKQAVVNMSRIADLSPEEQAKIIYNR